MLSPTAAGVRVPGSPEEVRSAGETNMSREENKSKFGGRLGYILNDSTALPRVTFSNGLIRQARCGYQISSTQGLYAAIWRDEGADKDGITRPRPPRVSARKSAGGTADLPKNPLQHEE